MLSLLNMTSKETPYIKAPVAEKSFQKSPFISVALRDREATTGNMGRPSSSSNNAKSVGVLELKNKFQDLAENL